MDPDTDCTDGHESYEELDIEIADRALDAPNATLQFPPDTYVTGLAGFDKSLLAATSSASNGDQLAWLQVSPAAIAISHISTAHDDIITSIRAFPGPSANTFASSSRDGSLKIWDYRTPQTAALTRKFHIQDKIFLCI